MNVNVNLKSHKNSFIKKIIILILFALFCFFIKENVFATSVPSFMENYTDLRVSCNNNFELCLGEESHSFQSFMEYYIIPTHPYVLIVQHDCTKINCIASDGTDYTGIWSGMYFFSEKPYFYKLGTRWFIYPSTNTTLGHSVFYYTLNSHIISSDGNQYLEFWKGSTDSTSEYYVSTNTEISSMVPLYSNFDLKDTYGNLIFANNSTGDVEWDNTEDIPDSDNRNWFEKLRDSIVDGFYNLGSFFVNLPKNIANAIKDLFIPGEELENFFEEEYEYIKKQLGFLTYPIEIVVEFADRFYEIDNTNSAVFKIPKLEIFDKTIYEGTEFDLMSLVNKNENIKYLYSIYKITVSGFIVLWLVQLAIKKEHEIFGGGTE